MGYIYETHLHTCEASACGRIPGAEYAEYMSARGYNGIIVTDHFFNGNSRISRLLPWRSRVAQYASGYEAALKASEETDFTVLFGIEFNFEGDEYLIYGPDPSWVAGHPEIMKMDRKAVYDLMHSEGFIMVQAHPYRERDYLSRIHLTPSICDGIEIYNAANSDNMNALSYRYAEQLGVPMSAGSDIHYRYDGPMGGMSFDRKIETIEDYVSAFLNREGTPVVVDNGKITPVTEFTELKDPISSPTLEVVRH